jgi:hypothetical protein
MLPLDHVRPRAHSGRLDLAAEDMGCWDPQGTAAGCRRLAEEIGEDDWEIAAARSCRYTGRGGRSDFDRSYIDGHAGSLLDEVDHRHLDCIAGRRSSELGEGIRPAVDRSPAVGNPAGLAEADIAVAEDSPARTRLRSLERPVVRNPVAGCIDRMGQT